MERVRAGDNVLQRGANEALQPAQVVDLESPHRILKVLEQRLVVLHAGVEYPRDDQRRRGVFAHGGDFLDGLCGFVAERGHLHFQDAAGVDALFGEIIEVGNDAEEALGEVIGAGADGLNVVVDDGEVESGYVERKHGGNLGEIGERRDEFCGDWFGT